MEPTKTRIVNEALVLFAKRGYDSISVAEIAEAVGIKAPSLYKHFKSKQAIFDEILTMTATSYANQANLMQMDGGDALKDVEMFDNIDIDTLLMMGKGLFLYFLKDFYFSNLRKMLTLEQYKNSDSAKLYRHYFIEEPIRYQSQIFSLLIAKKMFKPVDPKIMAIHFFTPLLTLLSWCDGDSDHEQAALLLVEQHIRQFNDIYLNRGQ